jgi:hypothetical protein
MSTPTELIFVGNCKKIIDNFKTCNKLIIKKADINVKEGTVNFNYASQEWGYYPVTF